MMKGEAKQIILSVLTQESLYAGVIKKVEKMVKETEPLHSNEYKEKYPKECKKMSEQDFKTLYFGVNGCFLIVESFLKGQKDDAELKPIIDEYEKKLNDTINSFNAQNLDFSKKALWLFEKVKLLTLQKHEVTPSHLASFADAAMFSSSASTRSSSWGFTSLSLPSGWTGFSALGSNSQKSNLSHSSHSFRAPLLESEHEVGGLLTLNESKL